MWSGVKNFNPLISGRPFLIYRASSLMYRRGRTNRRKKTHFNNTLAFDATAIWNNLLKIYPLLHHVHPSEKGSSLTFSDIAFPP